jgi:hypothetical protein
MQITQQPQTKTLTDLHPRQITLSDAFMFRSGGLLDFHVATLRKTLRATGKLDPLIVWRECDETGKETGRLVLLDGRHRLMAHDQCANAPILAHLKGKLPAFVITATPMDAHLMALQVNTKDTLALTSLERADAAWAMVWRYGEKLPKPKISRASGVSLRTIGRMRVQGQIFRQHEGEPSGAWWKDRLFPQDAPEFTQPTDAERAALIVALSTDVKEAILKHRCRDTDIMAEAIQQAVGPRSFQSMVEFLGIGAFEYDEFYDELVEARGSK